MAMKDSLMGLVIGDALGVPVEFYSREELKRSPVTGMRAGGSYGLPKGTWSDDSTMMLCLMESLTGGLDYDDQMDRFLRWANDAYMTPYGEVFDMGVSTRKALQRYACGTPALACGCGTRNENGNGSLMRILPLAFFLRRRLGQVFSSNPEAYDIIHSCSSLTHSHPISQMACGIYCSVINELTGSRENSAGIKSAVHKGIRNATAYYQATEPFRQWLTLFRRVDPDVLTPLEEADIQSTGYVVSTLEAALWCLLRTEDFASCLLTAVNLGTDTDTVAAVVGGLAGCVYPLSSLPEDWVNSIVRKEEIARLILAFEKSLA